MDYFIYFLAGVIIGSFLNVVALRLNSGLAFGGRSACLACNQKLRWWELLPILSFFVLQAKCGRCGAKISWQYPIVEILTGLVFLSIFNLEFSIFSKILILLVSCIYIVIAIYDIRHKIIPDRLVYIAIFVSIIYVFANLQTYEFLDLVAGPLLFSFFALVWAMTGGRAMGFGDAKLALSVGLLLGAAASFSAIIFAFWLGAAYGLMAILLSKVYPLLRGSNSLLKNSKGITMKSEVPFAPFIVIGAWLAIVFQLDLLNVSLF